MGDMHVMKIKLLNEDDYVFFFLRIDYVIFFKGIIYLSFFCKNSTLKKWNKRWKRLIYPWHAQVSTSPTSSNTFVFTLPNTENAESSQNRKLGFQIAVMALYSRVKSGISLCNKLGLLSSQRSTLQRSLIAPSISQVNNPFSISISIEFLIQFFKSMFVILVDRLSFEICNFLTYWSNGSDSEFDFDFMSGCLRNDY